MTGRPTWEVSVATLGTVDRLSPPQASASKHWSYEERNGQDGDWDNEQGNDNVGKITAELQDCLHVLELFGVIKVQADNVKKKNAEVDRDLKEEHWRKRGVDMKATAMHCLRPFFYSLLPLLARYFVVSIRAS